MCVSLILFLCTLVTPILCYNTTLSSQPCRTVSTIQTLTATFDEPTRFPDVPSLGLPGDLSNPLSYPYDGLQYLAFRVGSVGPESTVQLLSPPNAAYFSAVTIAEDETNPYITCFYRGSDVTRWELRSLALHCNINTAGNFNPVTPCKVKLTGNTSTNGTGAVSTTLSYEPGTTLPAHPTVFQIPRSFRGLFSVDFALQTVLEDAVINVVIDNVEVVLHQGPGCGAYRK